MPADVYSLKVDGRDDDFPHLYVVVVAAADGQLLCVPGYDTNGQKVNRSVAAMHRLGIYQGVGWVELDNSIEIQFHRKYTAKQAKWVAYRPERIEQRRLRHPVGTMRNVGLREIVSCLVQLHGMYPGSTLTDDELPLVRQLAPTLGVVLPANF